VDSYIFKKNEEKSNVDRKSLFGKRGCCWDSKAVHTDGHQSNRRDVSGRKGDSPLAGSSKGNFQLEPQRVALLEKACTSDVSKGSTVVIKKRGK